MPKKIDGKSSTQYLAQTMKRMTTWKKYAKSVLIVAAILFVFSLYPQDTTPDKERIAKAVASLYKAMVDRDEATLTDLTAESLTYGHSSGTIENKPQYIEAVVHGDFDFITIVPADQTISISGNTAMVRHIFITDALNAGNPVEIRIGCLMVFQKQKGQWKLLARQAYKL